MDPLQMTSKRPSIQKNFSEVIQITGIYASGVGQTGKFLLGNEKSRRGTAMPAICVKDQAVF